MARSTGNFYEDLLNQYQKGFNFLQQAHHIERQAIHSDLKKSQSEGDECIPRGQGKLLKLLLEKDGLFIKDIVLELDIRPSSASQLVNKLLGKGLVDRLVDDSDRRAKRIVLTEKGKACAEQIKNSHATMYQDILDGLDPEELQQLSALLKKLNTSLNEKIEASKAVVLEDRGHGHRSHNSRHGKSRRKAQIHSISGRKKHEFAQA